VAVERYTRRVTWRCRRARAATVGVSVIFEYRYTCKATNSNRHHQVHIVWRYGYSLSLRIGTLGRLRNCTGGACDRPSTQTAFCRRGLPTGRPSHIKFKIAAAWQLQRLTTCKIFSVPDPICIPEHLYIRHCVEKRQHRTTTAAWGFRKWRIERCDRHLCHMTGSNNNNNNNSICMYKVRRYRSTTRHITKCTHSRVADLRLERSLVLA